MRWPMTSDRAEPVSAAGDDDPYECRGLITNVRLNVLFAL